MASDIEKGDADDARRFVAYNLLTVGLTFDGYLKQYGLKCSEYLPDDQGGIEAAALRGTKTQC